MPTFLDEPEQDQNELLRKYGAVVGQSMASTPQPSAAEVRQTDELLKQYGGVVGEPDKSQDPAAALRAFDLAQPVSIPLRNAAGPVVPVQDDKPLAGWEKGILAPLNYLKGGMEQLGRGLYGVPHPQGETIPQKLDSEAGSFSDIVRGGLTTATPFFLPEAVAHPVAAAVGLGTFGAAQSVAESIAKKFGLPEGSSRLVGDLAGMYGGARIHGWLANLAKIPDKEVANAIYRRLEMTVDAMKDPTLSRDERAAAKAAVDAMMQGLRQAEGPRVFPPLFPNPNQAERGAYDYMRQDVGISPNAGMATGSPFIRGGQFASGMTPAGAVMDVQAKAKNLEAIRTRAARLAGEAAPPEPSRGYYAEFEKAADKAPAVNVPLSVDRDGSQLYGNVKVPVDIRDLKYELQPLYDKMQFMPMADRSSSHAYSALDALLKSPDHISGPAAEWGLSNFKKAARLEEGGVSEALAKRIIPQLQGAIDSSVREHAGDEALASLQKGRTAAAKEAGAEWLDEQFKKAQAEGGFSHEAVLWNNWARMKDTAKRTMFTQDQIQELDKFFLGLRSLAANPNPSGTALVAAIMAQSGYALHGGIVDPSFWLGQIGAAGVSKVLRSDFGVKLLTDGLRIPRTSERGRFIEQKLRKILGEGGGEPPEGPGGGAPPSPGGGEGGPATGGPAASMGKGPDQALAYAQEQIAAGKDVKVQDLQRRFRLGYGAAQKVLEGAKGPPSNPTEGGGGTPPSSPGGPGEAKATAQGTTPEGKKQAFIDRLKELISGEEGASPSRAGRPMSLQELMGEPEKVAGGEEAPRTLKLKPTGAGGQLLTSDLGQALEKSVSGRYRLGKEASPEKRMARGLESMIADLRYAIAEDDGGRGWYTDDIRSMEQQLIKARPEFKNKATMSLFKYLLGVTSNGVDPEVNFDAALRGWDMYQRDGKFSAYDATKASEFGNPKGLGLTFRANSYEGAMNRLSQLVADKGEAGAVEWLKTKHPVSELKEYHKDVPGKATEERYGAYILGEKVGSFGSNLNGIHTELTADKWWNRSWNRWMGTLMDTDKEGNIRFDDEGNPLLQDAPRNEGERNLMRDTAAKVADKLGLQVSELQAILWYAEQRLYRFYGIDASSVSYAGAARRQFGNARPGENDVNRAAPKGRGPDADNGKAGRGPPGIPQGIPNQSPAGPGQKVK